jgi:LemA protein
VVWVSIAIVLFWSMGAYNRLVRLRSQGILAFAALEVFLNQYVLIVKTNLPDASEQLSASDDCQAYNASVEAWVGLAGAVEQFTASLKMAHVQPLNGPTMSALTTALATLSSCWSRLRDIPPDLAGSALPGNLASQWEHVALQTEVASAEFNKRVVNYNEAINQFPALLLAWLFGFKPAQPI